MRNEKIETEKRLEAQLEEKSQKCSDLQIKIGQAEGKCKFLEGEISVNFLVIFQKNSLTKSS